MATAVEPTPATPETNSKPLIGKINDILGAATNPGMMRYGYLISPLACGLAALLLWLGSRSMTENSDTRKT